MIFFVLAGAIGFCVFMAMCVDNMLASKASKNREWLLIAFVGVFGVAARIIPGLSTFIAISIVGVLAMILFVAIFRSIQKGIVCAIFGAALLFGIEGITLLVSRQFGHEVTPVLLIHLYIAVALTVFLLSFLLKKFLKMCQAMDILNSQTMRFLLINAGFVLVFTYKGFILEHIRISFAGLTFGFGDIANILFVATSAVMFAIVIRYVFQESALRTERLLVEASKKYVQDLEESYRALRAIKHDYVNIMTTFKLYIDNENMAGLKKYYYDELSEMNKGLLYQDQLLSNLHNVALSEIKSILIYKCSIAAGQGIDINMEVKEPIDNLGVSTAIVCQMLGILLDNAIEAIAETDDKKLHIAIIKNPTSKVFIVQNTWKKTDVPINKLFELGFSTKADGRGIGLYTARNYTEKLKGLYLETEITDEYFMQTLTVKDG